jgi:hypothetical protein
LYGKFKSALTPALSRREREPTESPDLAALA